MPLRSVSAAYRAQARELAGNRGQQAASLMTLAV
jgi:hypothetical protein